MTSSPPSFVSSSSSLSTGNYYDRKECQDFTRSVYRLIAAHKSAIKWISPFLIEDFVATHTDNEMLYIQIHFHGKYIGSTGGKEKQHHSREEKEEEKMKEKMIHSLSHAHYHVIIQDLIADLSELYILYATKRLHISFTTHMVIMSIMKDVLAAHQAISLLKSIRPCGSISSSTSSTSLASSTSFESQHRTMVRLKMVVKWFHCFPDAYPHTPNEYDAEFHTSLLDHKMPLSMCWQQWMIRLVKPKKLHVHKKAEMGNGVSLEELNRVTSVTRSPTTILPGGQVKIDKGNSDLVFHLVHYTEWWNDVVIQAMTSIGMLYACRSRVWRKKCLDYILSAACDTFAFVIVLYISPKAYPIDISDKDDKRKFRDDLSLTFTYPALMLHYLYQLEIGEEIYHDEEDHDNDDHDDDDDDDDDQKGDLRRKSGHHQHLPTFVRESMQEFKNKLLSPIQTLFTSPTSALPDRYRRSPPILLFECVVLYVIHLIDPHVASRHFKSRKKVFKEEAALITTMFPPIVSCLPFSI